MRIALLLLAALAVGASAKDITGTLSIIVVDDHEHGTSHLETVVRQSDGTRVPVDPVILKGQPAGKIANALVSVTVPDDEEPLTASSSKLNVITPAHRRLQSTGTSFTGPPTHGTANVLVVLVSTSYGTEPVASPTHYPPSWVDTILFGTAADADSVTDSVDGWNNHVSNGQFRLDAAGSHIVEVTLESPSYPTTESACQSHASNTLTDLAVEALQGPGGEFEGQNVEELFDHLAFVFPFTGQFWDACPNTAFAQLRSAYSWYLDSESEAANRITTWHHELGHNRRWLHANTYFDNVHNEYADSTDIMGIDWCWGMLNAPHMHEVGWFTPAEVQQLRPGVALQQLRLGALGIPQTDPRNAFDGLPTPRAAALAFQWQPYQEAEQYWVAFVRRDDAYFSNPHPYGGCGMDQDNVVQVHRWNSHTDGSLLLAQLSMGETFTTDDGVTVAFLDHTATHAVVTVEQTTANFCTALLQSFTAAGTPYLLYNAYEQQVDKFSQWERREMGTTAVYGAVLETALHSSAVGRRAALLSFPLDGPAACCVSFNYLLECGTQSLLDVQVQDCNGIVVSSTTYTAGAATCGTLQFERFSAPTTADPICPLHLAFVAEQGDNTVHNAVGITNVQFGDTCFAECAPAGGDTSTCGDLGNDVCVDAVDLVGLVSYSAATATDDPFPAGSCLDTPEVGNHVWFRVTPETNGELVTVTATASDGGVVAMAAFVGSCAALEEVSCAPPSASAMVSHELLTGQVMYVAIGSSAAAGGGAQEAVLVNLSRERSSDVCLRMQELLGPGTFTTDNSGAVTDDGQTAPRPSCVSSNRHIWFSYTATCDATLVIDTYGSSFDTVLAVYAGTCDGTMSELACNDDFGGVQSELRVPVTAGTAVMVQVGAYGSGSGGSVVLSVAEECTTQECDPDPARDCVGTCFMDTDGDGVCDGDDVDHPCGSTVPVRHVFFVGTTGAAASTVCYPLPPHNHDCTAPQATLGGRPAWYMVPTGGTGDLNVCAVP